MPFSGLFQYDFVLRAFEAGIIIAVTAPMIGIFLVLRRYSLIADTLSHVSLAGLAIGTWLGINPIVSAIVATLISAFGIEKLRTSKKIYGESALALFLSGSLAVAIVILSISHGFNSKLFGYLFGSIVTVTTSEIYIIGILGVIILLAMKIFYKELVFITFDEETAQVSGIRTKMISMILILLASLTVSLAMPIVGVLLIAALIVIPVITALRFRKSFIKTILYAEIISVFSVLSGIVVSFYFDLATGGTIVLIMLAIFLGVMAVRK